MFDSFVPDGYLTFQHAMELAYDLLKPGSSDPKLKPDDKVRALLYSGKLSSWVLDEHGKLVRIPSHFWGVPEFVLDIRMEGQARFTIEKDGKSVAISGRVLFDKDEVLLIDVAGSSTGSNQSSSARTISAPLDGGENNVSSSRGGRPRELDWDAIWTEICAVVFEDGLPETHAKLIRKVLERAQSRLNRVPEESTLKPKIRSLFRRLKSE